MNPGTRAAIFAATHVYIPKGGGGSGRPPDDRWGRDVLIGAIIGLVIVGVITTIILIAR